MRILLTGTTGKVGGFLAQHWQPAHEVTPLTRAKVNLSEQDELAHFLQENHFDLLVNPAAVSTPEACEKDPELAHQVNVAAPATMAKVCAEKNLPFIHFSTDYVLDGSEPGFKDEQATCQPNNTYGQTKLAGEHAVLTAHPSALVTRVSWVFGSAGEGFLEKVFRQIQEGVALEGVADKYSMPTSAAEIAHALDHLLGQNATGLFHLTQTAKDPVSWHRYALEVAAAVHEAGLTPEPIPVTARKMADIPVLRTNRPIHTAMKPVRIANFSHSMSPWTVLLRKRVQELAREISSQR